MAEREKPAMQIQGWAKVPFPGCENAAGNLRQKWLAKAATKFTKPLATPVREKGPKTAPPYFLPSPAKTAEQAAEASDKGEGRLRSGS